MPKFARPNSYNGRQATQNLTGDLRAATDAEAIAGIKDNLAVSPANLIAAADTIVGSVLASGNATLVAGVAVVANTSILASDKIIPFHIAPGASTELGVMTYVISAGVGFTITSRDPLDATVATGDTSSIGYLIVGQI